MSIKNLFKRLFDVEEGETGRVGLLLIMSFFLGAFLASFTVGAQSIFLLKFSETKDLPLALLISGVFGVVATFTYNFLQNRIPFQTLGLLSLLVVTALTGLIEFGEAYFADNQYIAFLAFTQLAPFTFISLLIFWGSFNRMFNVKQSKRLLGSVDIGYLFASLIAFFTIPTLLNNGVTTEDLYSISLVAVACFTILFVILARKYVTKTWTFKQEKKAYKKISTKDFFSNKYILYMTLFIVVSLTAMIFVDYSFLSVSPQYFDSVQLPKFLSYFEAMIVIFSVLFQTFAADRIINDYGLRVAVLVNPIIIALFTAAALTLGSVFGYTPDNPSFVIFFIMIAMSKLFTTSMRDSLDEPTFKLYMLPIDSSIKIDVQTKIEGLVTAFASIAAGGLLILINKANLTFISITAFTIPLIAIWYFAANRMYGSYRHTLQNALEGPKDAANEEDEKEYMVDKVLERQVNSTIEDRVIYGLKLMEKLEPAQFETTIIRLTDSTSPKVKAFADEQMKILGLDEDHANREIQSLAKTALGQSEDSDLISVSTDNLMRLSKSTKPADRILAAKLLRKLISQKTIFILLELLRDMSPRVRIEALQTARKVKRPETWSVLIELLSSPTYGHYAAAALIEADEAVLPTLDTAFHKSGQSEVIMLRVIQLTGRIGTPAALNMLWKKIDYPDKRIVKQILYSLRYVHFQKDARKVSDVMDLLETEMGKTLWNQTALEELPKTEEFELLRDAVKEEISDNYEQITMLLAMIYDPKAVQLVKENIESGNPDKIQYALELLDLFVSQELKQKLFPLLDDMPIAVKLNKLQIYFPRESYNPIQVINYILNRDFNSSNRWTKACAAYASAFIPNFRISRGLISQIFNQDKVLQETAAWVIYNKDKKRYAEISERLPAQDKKFLESSMRNNQLLDGLNDGFFLAIEVVMFLKTLMPFKDIAGVNIADLADKILPVDMNTGDRISFNLNDPNPPVFIVAHGEVKLLLGERHQTTLKKGDVYGEIFQSNNKIVNGDQLQATERTVVFKIMMMDLFFVLASHYELVDGLVKNVTGRRQKALDEN